MHRPALLNYWFNQMNRNDPQAIMDMIESVSVRPVPMYFGDPPNRVSRNVGFSGSNYRMQLDLEALVQTNGIAAYNLADHTQGVDNQLVRLFTFLINPLTIDGTWDVDNKGDGKYDSVWIDPQFPIMSTKDGRRYKVLVAPLVEGLDGRINVNAVGNWAQISTRYDNDIPNPMLKIPGATGAFRLAQGRGYGPAEINIKPLLGNGLNDVQKRRLIAELLMNKYGLDRMPGARSPLTVPNGADVMSDDILIQYFHIGMPAIFGAPPNSGTHFYGVRTNPSAYGTTPDVFGRGTLALTYAGHPVYLNAGLQDNLRDELESLFSNTELVNLFGQWPLDIIIDERTESPYQLDLLSQNANDDPFTVFDLELLLRKSDLDVSTKRGRLAPLAGRSELVTSHSFEIPSMQKVRNGGNPVTIARLMRNRVNAALQQAAAMGGAPVTDERVDTVTRSIVPFELYRGNRLNLNRLFGNGRDDQMVDTDGNVVRDRDGIVDNYDEIYDPNVNSETVYRYFGSEVKPYYADTVDPRMGRQVLARHLYCLLMAVLPNNNNLRPANIPRHQWLAQLAVNMVDFRDSDATFTIFEYDTNPFDGWDVDGDLSTDEGGNRGYVYGMEHPDLLLTESFAIHDRRVKDTPWDTSMQLRDRTDPTANDRDLDQYRIPEGSWFFELSCVRNRLSEDAVVPGDLYDQATGALDIGRLAGRYFDNNGDPQFRRSADDTVRPVWRVVVADRQKAVDIKQANGVSPTLLTIDEGAIVREVWFTDVNPRTLGISKLRAARIFYSSAATGLFPGQYAVVGPRSVTAFGSQIGGPNPPAPPQYRPSSFGVDMTDTLAGVTTVRPAGLPQTPPLTADPNGGANDVLRDTLRSVPIVVEANAPENWGGWNGDERIGLNLTEPLPYETVYYRKPTHKLAADFPLDSYYDVTNMQGALPDVPFDQSPVPLPLPSGFKASDARPLRTLSMLRTRTYSAAYNNAAYLQRLADPSRAWHVQTNPYITVDTIDLDVTVFNGEDNNHNAGWTGNFDQFANGNPINTYANRQAMVLEKRIRFQTRIKSAQNQNIWTTNTIAPTDHSRRAGNDHFGFGLFNSLGYLNDDGENGGTSPGFGFRYGVNDAQIQPQYYGTPRTNSVPWLSWNDRPYNSTLELLRVPTSSPGRFLVEFGLQNSSGNLYSDLPAEYPHLLNWFTGTGTDSFEDFLEFVEVPSPFVNTQELINPGAVQVSADTYDPMNDVQSFMFNDAFSWMRPPFNTISRFRNPGKVNWNMMSDARVWQSLTWSSPDPNNSTFWNMWGAVQSTRRGYSPEAKSNFSMVDIFTDRVNFDGNLNPDYPTQFHGAFSSSLTSNRASSAYDRPRNPMDFTMLRPDSAGMNPRFDVNSGQAYRNTSRNPYFRYEGMQRLKNLTTHQSNVYAVWLTLGYFEVTPRFANANYPDGYQLGRELGSDDGSIERPRYFYIIDRSIPVAFEPGKDQNVRDTIRLNRRID
jgi:hypothetical protein